jgi:PAS domain S-box-containing protein
MDVKTIFQKHRARIAEEWLYRLQNDVSPAYSARPRKELQGTISNAIDGNFLAIIDDDYSRLDDVIDHIVKLRGKSGFRLSDVQRAFELFRIIMLPILSEETGCHTEIFERLNNCMAYTIHKFSDYFQELHEREITKYAQELEAKVLQRTRELAESESKYRRLVEKIRDGYFVYQQGRIVFVNKAFCDMHGYEPEEVIGKDFWGFVAPESHEELRELYRKWAKNQRTELQYTYSRLSKQGGVFPTENKIIRTRYQGDSAVIGICRDITKRVEIEKRVREAERLAHIGQLTTSLAHEIRNPLSSAGMSIQDLLKSVSVSGNDKRRIEILAKELNRVNKIVTEMLDFAKPVEFDFKPSLIGPLVSSCLDILDGRIREKSVFIDLDVPEGIPELSVDWEKMVQAIINVLLNSIEAVDRDGRIAVSIRCTNKMVQIAICDNGQGVSGEDLQYIFDPFFSKKRKGTGLGLANAKKIIEAHKGKIELKPLRPGTCVHISLPLLGPRVTDRSGDSIPSPDSPKREKRTQRKRNVSNPL